MGSSALVVALLLAGPIVTFQWIEPADGPTPEFYEVEFDQEGEDLDVLATSEPAVSLTPLLGRDFQVRVRACVQIECGDWSELSQALSLNRSSDLNQDGVVGVPDYGQFARAFGTSGAADLDGDTVVGLSDYAEFAQHFGTCVGSVLVDGAPQPAYVPCVWAFPEN